MIRFFLMFALFVASIPAQAAWYYYALYDVHYLNSSGVLTTSFNDMTTLGGQVPGTDSAGYANCTAIAGGAAGSGARVVQGKSITIEAFCYALQSGSSTGTIYYRPTVKRYYITSTGTLGVSTSYMAATTPLLNLANCDAMIDTWLANWVGSAGDVAMIAYCDGTYQ